MAMTHIPVPPSDYQIVALESEAVQARDFTPGTPAAEQPIRTDKASGLPVWELQAAISHGGELVHNGKVKVLAASQPRVQAMQAIAAETVRITPWVNDSSKRPRVELSWAITPAQSRGGEK